VGIVRSDKNSKPRVSVIMSVYNDETYLTDAILSILEQTYEDFEFIIINDGSSDDSLRIIQEFANQDPRIIIVTRKNKGLALSLNEAILLAKGEYVARMDSDDIALPDRLKIQFDYMKSNPEIDILGGQGRLIDELGQELRDSIKPISSEDIHKYLKFASPLIHPTYMVKTSVYRETGGYRNFKVAQDFDFLLRADEAGYRLGNVPDHVLLYRDNKSGLSANNAMRQMRAGRLLLVLHRYRVAGKLEPPNILFKLESRSEISSRWFNFLWRKRNKAIIRSKVLTGNQRRFCLLGIIFISLMHYELFLSS